MSSRSGWSTEQVQGQTLLHRKKKKTGLEKTNKKKTKMVFEVQNNEFRCGIFIYLGHRNFLIYFPLLLLFSLFAHIDPIPSCQVGVFCFHIIYVHHMYTCIHIWCVCIYTLLYTLTYC